jgi:non-ribosomal peptide synthetase component F/acyl carrier protein
MSARQEPSSGRASFVQQGIWLNELRTEMHDAYHLPFTLSFDGELDIASILAACTAVLGRHGALTQAFSERDGSACVRPAEHAPEVAQADLSGLPGGQLESELEHHMRRSIERPFDLCEGPLLRMTLYTLGPARHILLLVAHHLIFDGLSLEIFTRDLLRAYGHAVAGREPALPQLRFPAEEYAAAEERRVADILPDAQRFWRRRRKEPQQMLLPGVTRPVRPVDVGEQVKFSIDGSARVELLNVCRNLGITEFDFLLASLHCLLRRYGNDLPVITIALGLRPAEYNEHIGSFAQELPFALPVERGTPFSDFALGLHANLRELYKYRMVPLNRAIPGVPPSGLHTDVALSYLPVERDIQLPRLRVRINRMSNSWVRGALSALVHAEDSALRFIVRYPSRTLSRDDAQRIAGHWRQFIGQMTATPDARIDTVSPLSAAERDRMLVSSNEPAAAGLPGTVLDLISEQAVKRPDVVAARSGTAEITYGEWQDAAENLAQRIACLGLPRGSVIAICAGRSIAMLTGILAVLKSGNAYLIVGRSADLASSALRRSIGAVLVEAHDLDRPEFGGLITVGLDSRGCACGQCKGPSARPRPEEKAYVACSSGPDGTVGLAEYDHRAMRNGLCALAETLSIEPGDSWLPLCPPSSAAGPLVLLPALSGAQVVMAGAEDAEDGGRLLTLIGRHDVTHMQATPSIWQRLLDAGFDNPGLSAVSSGEALQLSLARRLRRHVRRLWNAYGVSGAIGWSMCAEVLPDAKSITIGRPVAGTRVYVLDEFGALAPIGSAGEVCIAGHGLALGYSGQPAATAARFMADPFGPPGTRMLRTRDRARFRPDGDDGEIVMLGQAGRRVRLHGQYAELADVEARLGAHPAVARCVVVPRDEEDGSPSLVAYFVSPSAERPSDTEFDTWLADALPEGTRLTYIDLDEFPLGDDGQLDVAGLRERPGHDDAQPAGTEMTQATDEDVEAVRQIWQQILKVKNIGVQDNLFDFRVDSLAVIRISSAIYRKTGVDIPLESFYQLPTVIGIANIIARARQDG